MEKAKWVWMPHPGHFIGSKNCKFHLNTYVGKYIVSTIGEYWTERRCREIHAEIHDKQWFDENRHRMGDDFDHAYFEKFGWEEIGCDRTYETMVFKAGKADRVEDLMCCPYEVSNHDELDFDGYKTATEAYKGHLRLCDKWSKK